MLRSDLFALPKVQHVLDGCRLDLGKLFVQGIFPWKIV